MHKNNNMWYVHVQVSGELLPYMKLLMKAMPEKCKMQSYEYGSPGKNLSAILCTHLKHLHLWYSHKREQKKTGNST